MKKIQREIYIILAGEVDFCLCAFCKYSKVESGYSPCDCGEPYCVHPLRDSLQEQWGSYVYGIEPGGDCWGFRPSHPVAFCADIVGIILEKGWQDVVWWQNKKDTWKIASMV